MTWGKHRAFFINHGPLSLRPDLSGQVRTKAVHPLALLTKIEHVFRTHSTPRPRGPTRLLKNLSCPPYRDPGWEGWDQKLTELKPGDLEPKWTEQVQIDPNP